jgi:hypothetical protein
MIAERAMKYPHGTLTDVTRFTGGAISLPLLKSVG